MHPQCHSINASVNNRTGSLWLMDSGCTEHITNNINDYITYTPFELPKEVYLAKVGAKMDFIGFGVIRAVINYNDKQFSVELNDVLYIPDAAHRYLSIRRLDKQGMYVNYGNNKASILRNNTVVAQGHSYYDQYWLDLVILSPSIQKVYKEQSIKKGKAVGIDTWHNRYGHVSYTVIDKAKTNVKGLEINPKLKRSPHPCQSCTEGKDIENPFHHQKRDPLNL